MPLHEDATETVRLERWEVGTKIDVALEGGGEFFALTGGFTDSCEDFEQHSWIRLPSTSRLVAKAGQMGALDWLKIGHLKNID